MWTQESSIHHALRASSDCQCKRGFVLRDIPETFKGYRIVKSLPSVFFIAYSRPTPHPHNYTANTELCWCSNESPHTFNPKGPSTLATLFNHMWPRIVADPSTLGRHVAATCMLCMQTLCLWRGRATACRTLEPQTAVCSPKLENNGFLRE